MEKQISIIIPTYNMEAYIGKCLDSLIIPEFDAVEVLVVNDGSKDRSSEIVHSYADRYPASIRVIDKPNGNYGSCINAALPLATGRYVKILDADDTFDTDAFSRLLRLLPGTNSDIVVTDMVTVNERGEITNYTYRASNLFTSAVEYILSDIYRLVSRLGMHSISYKKEIFRDSGYRQTEGISYTDNEWIYYPISLCKTLIYYNIGDLYRYLLGREGQTMDAAVYAKKAKDIFTVLDNMSEIYANMLPLNEKCFMPYLHYRLTNALFSSYIRLTTQHTPEYSKYLSDLDAVLKEKIPAIYDELGRMWINNHTPYCPVKAMRNFGFSHTYTLPIYVKLMSAATKLSHKIICWPHQSHL